jgi:hypothetical protein
MSPGSRFTGNRSQVSGRAQPQQCLCFSPPYRVQPRRLRPMSPPSDIVIFMVVMALVLHGGLAFASPSDPTWIAGFYDGDDGDDIVILIGDEMLSDGVSVPLIPPPGKLPGSLRGPSRGDIQALHARQ